MNSKLCGTVGCNIRNLRRRAGWNQGELAARLGISQSSLSMIEKGRNQPTLKTIQAVLDVFRVPATAIFPAPAEGASAHPPALESGAVQLVSFDDPPLTPKVAGTLGELINHVLALEDLCSAQKHPSIPLHMPLALSASGLETLARQAREHLCVHDGIVFDYYELFESFGLRVLVLPLRASCASACYYDHRNENAFFFINSRNNPEKQLFQLAWQFGRLLLFNWAARRGGYPETEPGARLEPRRAAAQFAAYLLMPARAVQATVTQLGIHPGQWTYELLLRIKHRFGVSAEAFLYRLGELDLVAPDLKEQLKAAIKTHYQKTNYAEPDDSRRILTPNGRLWDLVLSATLHHGEQHEELAGLVAALKKHKVVKL